ncbi:MAG TPA: ATP-dependent helicase HrpB [Gemmatimonadaceae bacterium]|nr:ATP-dependent helicase HrpB [Gemmatimonadaceae bacterium]
MPDVVSSLPSLPIDAVLAPLRAALRRASNVVLQAPPGAGKTTRVPLALLEESWLEGRRVLMLEPRRLAARAAARRMASSLGESVGATIGFRVRGESRVGSRTRVEVVTEGILTRMLHRDPALDDVGVVIFDEFHERSLHADLGLALTLESQSVLRPELRILVMSATLDGARVSALLGDAPVVSSEGRAFPVEVRYRPRRADHYLDVAVASAVRRALADDAGSILVFLPGAGEIRSTMQRLMEHELPPDVTVMPLFGALGPDAQDAALAPPPPGHRKVVLATSIAQTSLTIEGVHVVIDAGLARVPSFSPRMGMSRLETVRVSRASADQRCGRAGRVAPGICYRLWPAEEHAGLLERDRPEILDADLAPLALDLALAGIVDAGALRWLDLPPAPALAQARELLHQLGALGADGRITAHGHSMARLATHPRLAHMLLRGRELGMSGTACVVASLLDERDVVRGDTTRRDADLRARIALVVADETRLGAEVDRDVLRRVREQNRVWRNELGVDRSDLASEADCGALVALAFPDRVARRRQGSGERYLLRSGLGAVLADGSSLTGAPFVSIAELDGQRPHARILLAAPLERSELDRLFADQVETEDLVSWSETSASVSVLRRERLGAIVLRESPAKNVDDAIIAEALLAELARGDSLALRWSVDAQRTRERLAFLHRHAAGWPDVGEGALLQSAREWLLPHLSGLRRRSQVDELDLSSLLLARLTWEQRAHLDELAPTHFEVPTGSRIRIDYGDAEMPVLAVRLQELFGLEVTPAVAGGRVPLTLHLLSPAYRPVQVTRDLAGFWKGSYFEVRRELRGRYPKHEWPEEPVRAAPTRRAKRRE